MARHGSFAESVARSKFDLLNPPGLTRHNMPGRRAAP